MHIREIKVGMVLLYAPPNRAFVVRITRVGGGNFPTITMKRADELPWRPGGFEAVSSRPDWFQPLDPGIAALYGVDQKED